MGKLGWPRAPRSPPTPHRGANGACRQGYEAIPTQSPVGAAGHRDSYGSTAMSESSEEGGKACSSARSPAAAAASALGGLWPASDVPTDEAEDESAHFRVNDAQEYTVDASACLAAHVRTN